MFAAKLLQLSHKAGILATLHADEEAKLGVRGSLLGGARGVRNAQSSGGLEMTGKILLVDEIEHGLQGMLLMFNRDLANGAYRPCPPCAKIGRRRSARELRAGMIGETSPGRSMLQLGEPGALLLDQIFGDDRDAQGSTRDLPGPPTMPIAQSPGASELASHLNVCHLFIEK